MLDPKLIRNSLKEVADNLARRGYHLDVNRLNDLESQRKKLQVQIQELQNARNVQSKAVGLAKSQGKDIADELIQLKELSDALKALDSEFGKIQNQLESLLADVPNLIHSSVPDGKSEKDNQLIRQWGEPKQFKFEPKDHVALCANYYMDFETAAKIAGSRFVVLRGPLARLQRALTQFMLDIHTKEYGYQEIYVPFIVTADTLFGTSQLPKFKEDLFALREEGQDRYLISTSEIAVTNTVRDQIIDAKLLPLKYVCDSTCFRSEAGSYGKDIRGMLRQHQFEKVELVQIVHPEKSYEALEDMTRHAESILQRLNLPYQVVALCSADIGFAAAKTYDLEVWLPGQNCYREISSCSNTESFQARRMKARVRDEKGQIELLHTLNGSGLAVGRTLIALVENYQDELGRIHIPAALQPYMNGLQVIDPIV